MTRHARTSGVLTACCILLGALLIGCPDGTAPQNDPDLGGDTSITTDGGSDVTGPACQPNLDGRIDSREMAPAIGIPATYGVATGMVPVDVVGEGMGDDRFWDWSMPSEGEQLTQLTAESIDGKWYETAFPNDVDLFVVDFDVAGSTESVYQHTDDALLLHGVVSAEEMPASGQTLLIYDEPVELYRFPIQEGGEWVSVGTIRNGVAFGLPYAGRDTYVTTIDARGDLALEFLELEGAYRASTHVTLQPSVGVSTSRRQVSWLYECYGEVARAVSLDNEDDPDFTVASEVRRLSL